MGSLIIDSEYIKDLSLGIVDTIQTKIIDASTTSKDTIINAIENSSGDFIESLREEIEQEVASVHAIGELLIALADYVQSASEAFSNVDSKYKPTLGLEYNPIIDASKFGIFH